MNIYILLAHPDKDSFNGQLADACQQTLLQNGHEVRRQNIDDLDFDPILWKGYAAVQELEPDLKLAQKIFSGATGGSSFILCGGDLCLRFSKDFLIEYCCPVLRSGITQKVRFGINFLPEDQRISSPLPMHPPSG